jgi:hypothetical protein
VPPQNNKKGAQTGRWWLSPVIPATQEAEIRRIAVQSQPRQIVCETLSRKKKNHKKRVGGVAQGVGPEFNSQNCQKKKKGRGELQTVAETGDGDNEGAEDNKLWVSRSIPKNCQALRAKVSDT